MAGFCRTIKEESDSLISKHILDYVINLLDDARDFSLASAKASHVVFFILHGAGKKLQHGLIVKNRV